MWQVLLAAFVAGSTGFVTNYFLTPKKARLPPPPPPPSFHNANNNTQDLNAKASYESEFGSDSETRDGNGVFTFSSPESLRQGGSHSRSRSNKLLPRGSNNGGVRVPKVERSEQRKKGGRRLHFCLKKRKTANNVLATKAPSCCSKDNSSFGWGLGFGIMYMMSAGKAEINKLNKTMDEIATSVQELKSELNRRKSSCAHQNLDSDGNIDMNSCKISDRHDKVMIKKPNSKFSGTDAKIWSPVNDGGECGGSSTLTEEPEPEVFEMDQLQAELEFELQKLSGCSADSPCHEIIPKLYETSQILFKFMPLPAASTGSEPVAFVIHFSPYEFGFDQETAVQLEVPDESCNGTDDLNFNYSQSHGVLASELNQKLSLLLIKQQEIQITELESELHLAQSSLHQKEVELQELKDCVRCLTDLSLSTVSDDETQALTDPKGTSALDNNNIQSESKQSVVGVKRPFDSESCSYCM